MGSIKGHNIMPHARCQKLAIVAGEHRHLVAPRGVNSPRPSPPYDLKRATIQNTQAIGRGRV